VIPFPAEDWGDEYVGEFEDVTGQDRGWVNREGLPNGSSGRSELRPYKEIPGNTGDGME
jgi:hypothetical protein